MKRRKITALIITVLLLSVIALAQSTKTTSSNPQTKSQTASGVLRISM